MSSPRTCYKHIIDFHKNNILGIHNYFHIYDYFRESEPPILNGLLKGYMNSLNYNIKILVLSQLYCQFCVISYFTTLVLSKTS